MQYGFSFFPGDESENSNSKPQWFRAALQDLVISKRKRSDKDWAETKQELDGDRGELKVPAGRFYRVCVCVCVRARARI